MRLDLGVLVALVTFHQNQIDGRQFTQQILQRWFTLISQFMHQSKAIARRQQHLARPCRAVAIAVFARVIHIETMMRMFYSRNGETTRSNLAHQTLHQPRLTRVFPPHNAINLHSNPSARIRSSGVFTLKNGSNGSASNIASRPPC